jgi:D-hydroxyproline dehydrogenase subunit alpha
MRLKGASVRPVGAPVRFTFEGREIEALEGETIAASLSAAGIVGFRRTPSGAPRGLHCGMGACYDCVVTVDGRIGQRACLTKVSGQSVISDEWSVVSGQASEAKEWACGVLVVGGGPAGLSAAIAAAEAGAEVVLLDERAALGGQYAKPLAESHIDRAPDRQFRFGEELRRRAAGAGIRVETEATVWGAFGPEEIAALIRGRAVTLRPKRLILAPGAHERPVPLPGWTLPGVMTTGALQGLVRTQRVCPGERVLIAGNGPLNLQLACELLACGPKPVAVVEAAPRPGPGAWELMRWAPDLAWQGLGMLARLKAAGVPVLWNTEVSALEGDNRVRRALAGRHEFAVDVVALNEGFQPETGIARALGIPHRFVDRGAGYLATEADEEGRTPLGTVFAVGDGADLGGARVAAARGRLAGLAAARDLGFAAPEERETRHELRRTLRFQEALWRLFRPPVFAPERLPDEVVVCRCEEVTAGRIRAALADGLASLPAVKKATRAGMGRCQGRFCAATVARLCGGVPDEFGFAAPRAPVRPTPAGPLMFEAAEFEAPLLEAPASPRLLPRVGGERGEAEVVVLGGGLMGLCSALFLAREGADVLVIERDEAGMAASTANAGSLHVQLLSYNFAEDGPEDGGPAGQMLPLAPQSIALWKEIAAEAGEDLGIRTEGGLMVADSEAAMRWLRKKSQIERRLGIESHVLGANELRNLAPAISERMIGADFVPAEGYGDPLRGTMAVRKLALKAGVRVMPGTEVQGLAREGSRWVAKASRGEVRAGKVVNATGPWAGVVGQMVGLRLPVSGTVQQVIVTEPVPQRMTRHLIACARRHLSLKQQVSGGFLIGGGWFGEVDPATGRTRNVRRSIEGNLWVCGQVLPALRGLHFIRSWTGLSPVTDRAPILGEAPGVPGFFNVVSGNGYTLGPILGRLTAEAVQGRGMDPRYTLARFG